MSEIVNKSGYEFTPVPVEEKIEFIKKKFGKNLEPVELEYLMYVAKEYGLDPNKNEIFAIKYGKNPATIIVSRDGLLGIAHKTGNFDGIETKILYEDENGEIKEAMITPSTGRLIGAVCRVWRKDTTHPFVASVRLDEYVKGSSPIWDNMPETMIKKVAEAHALRRAFNIHGIYTEDEVDSIITNQKAAEEPSTKALEYLNALVEKYAAKLNTTPEKVLAKILTKYGKNSVSELTKSEVSEIIEKLKANLGGDNNG